MKPSRRDLSYSLIAVFFTCPCAVAKTRYWSGENSRVAMIAVIDSFGASGTRLTAAVPRAVRSFIGISWPRSRYTLPWFEKSRRKAWAEVCTTWLTRSSSLSRAPCTPRPPRPWVRKAAAATDLM